jgi:hypothetical protein
MGISEISMFEWLRNEMARVNTAKFYIVDGSAPADLREAIEHSDVPIPPSYEAFVLQFGNAKLYRQGSVYLVQVFASLLDAESNEGETLLQFGRTDMSLAYFKESLLIRGQESPVFEWYHEQGLRQTAANFEEWLRVKCAAARGLFKKKEWEAIEKGPQPFSAQEKAIVEARKRFRWRVVGIALSGDLRFKVHNGSDLVLPFLSIGIRGKLRPPKSGPLNGGIWLPVSSVLPGETQIIEKGCYKNLVDPKDVEAFAEPDPEPEDRDRYWEFKAL